jgi:hypothetical protein
MWAVEEQEFFNFFPRGFSSSTPLLLWQFHCSRLAACLCCAMPVFANIDWPKAQRGWLLPHFWGQRTQIQPPSQRPPLTFLLTFFKNKSLKKKAKTSKTTIRH